VHRAHNFVNVLVIYLFIYFYFIVSYFLVYTCIIFSFSELIRQIEPVPNGNQDFRMLSSNEAGLILWNKEYKTSQIQRTMKKVKLAMILPI